MGKVRVNADAFVYTVPNPAAGQAPVPRSAFHGDVIEVDAEQERRGRELEVNRHYPVAGTTNMVRAKEPALVDVDYDSVAAGRSAAIAARRRQLEAELAALGGPLDAAELPTIGTVVLKGLDDPTPAPEDEPVADDTALPPPPPPAPAKATAPARKR